MKYNIANQKSLKLNFIMNVILTMSSFIFPLITFPYISRILLPQGMGKISFATSLISYFSMFAQLGIPTYGIRACSKVRDNKEALTRTAHELLIINLIMDAISYTVLAIAIFYIPKLYEDRLLYILISSTIILTSIGMEWLYKALEQYTYITIRSIIFKIVALLAMFFLVHKQDDYVIYGVLTIFAASASNIFNFMNIHKYIDLKPIGNYDIKRHLKPIAIFFAMSCATIIYTHMDTIMLGFMTTDKDVGYYHAAVRIKSILVSIVTSLGTVLLPRVSYFIEHGMLNEFQCITKKALNFVVLTASPLMFYFILFAEQGIYLLSGSAYTNSIIPMKIIMPTLLFIGITNILGIQILIPLGKEKSVLFSEISGAIVNVIINGLLIPKFASIGAAIGTLVAEFVVLFYQCTVLRNEVKIVFRSISYWKILFGLIFGWIGSQWIVLLNIGVFTTLVISAFTFFGLYGLILLILKEKLALEVCGQILRMFNKNLKIQ
ncbi:flippase [Holdemania massiliensis]|uniref:Oligosaccharide flippase family protein n=1 Tax=Holdemania massiliensis TaxID=1468449 RepID=A0A6N7S6F2_9FIRM|nr:flippase [Holdemania massiliensis]MSA71138.1 oligosaccharide flippase family protein [Holdemania massiliensis]MSA89464.1 oligosaccharide flippase family protein [Holdemania massiliensis]MSB78237.1 oligosaccharide flippase family protein [Holdemania massiliensis]MSC33142.1 oligosaccharide flippase family protein [Holdemania massiliensis]MSC39548.1 oligosaccharide flippase family protein [Holdemania massiliensis]